jgi:hypothetical protein
VAEAVQYWIESFPADQLLVLQYEQLTNAEHQSRVLSDIQHFMGLGSQPNVVGNTMDIFQAENMTMDWVMPKEKYANLVEFVRRDAEQLAELLASHDLTPSAAYWLEKWNHIWQTNLNSCGSDGLCHLKTV